MKIKKKKETKVWDLMVPVFHNKRTGQAIVMLPKKKLKQIPKWVRVSVR